MQVTTTAPLFSAVLRPDRSLPATGGWIGLVLAAIVGTPFLLAAPELTVPGVAAYGMAGAGLTAFGMHQSRHRRQRQTVTVWPDQVEIGFSAPGIERQLHRFDSKAVRLRLERDGFERTTGIFLRHGADEIELGGFLAADDKASFARAFGSALRLARRAA